MSKAKDVRDKMSRAERREIRRQDRTGMNKDERVANRKDKLGNLTQKLVSVGGVALGLNGGIQDVSSSLIKSATRSKEEKLKVLADMPPNTDEREISPIFNELDEVNDIIKQAQEVIDDDVMDYEMIEIQQNDQNEWSVASQRGAREAALASQSMMDLSVWSVKRVLRWSMVWIFLAIMFLAASYIFIANRELSLAVNTILGILIGNIYKERSQVLGFSVGSTTGSKIKSIKLSSDQQKDN